MTELSPKARDLFARARREGGPTAAQKAALLSRIETRAAAPAKGSGWSWLMFGASALVIVAILAFFASESSKGDEVAKPVERPLVALPLVAAAVEEPRVEIAVPEPQPEPEIVPEPAVAPVHRVARTPIAREASESPSAREVVAPERSAECELAAEQALYAAAGLARRQGHDEQAEALLVEHRRECPNGVFAQQRDVMLAKILCDRGDLEAGRAIAARHRGSVYGSVIDQSCGEDR